MPVKRESWLDTYKGIGMLLVILAHFKISSEMHSFIYSFHMPLFFFASGLMAKISSISLHQLFKKKAKALLVPYYIFGLIQVLVIMLFALLQKKDWIIALKISTLNLLYGISDNKLFEYRIITIWFLMALFIVNIMFYSITKKVKSIKFIFVASLISLFIGHLFSIFITPHFRLLFSIDSAFSGLFFFCLGYMFSQISKESTLFNKIKSNGLPSFLIGFFLLIITVIISSRQPQVYYMAFNSFSKNAIAVLACVIFGTLGVYFIATLLDRTKISFILRYIGKNSIVYLVTHQQIGFALLYFLKKLNLIDNGYFITLLIIPVTIPLIWLFNKYLPFCIGKQKKVQL